MNDRTADWKSGRAAVLAIGLLGVILSAILWGSAGILLGQSLQPTSPAKEYVYVGGRLVAVEVPGPGGGTPVTVTVMPVRPRWDRPRAWC